MPVSKTKIWIHALFGTKDRLPLIHEDFENKVHNFLAEELTHFGCQVESINGAADHVHIIFLLNPQKTLTDVIDQIKETSANAINQNHFSSGSFSWQADCCAFSISESQLPKIIDYIKNQKEHHKKQTFLQEYNEFMRLHGLSE